MSKNKFPSSGQSVMRTHLLKAQMALSIAAIASSVASPSLAQNASQSSSSGSSMVPSSIINPATRPMGAPFLDVERTGVSATASNFINSSINQRNPRRTSPALTQSAGLGSALGQTQASLNSANLSGLSAQAQAAAKQKDLGALIDSGDISKASQMILNENHVSK
jgi:hypothetical protein